ncbi:MAG: DUF3667 domain-containing protein [Acidobacteriota bacterium]
MSTSSQSLSCPNCGQAEVGAFCPSCGQKQGELLVSVRDWLEDVAEAIFSVDSKLVASLRRLLFTPGALTRDWLQGRRARYLTPLRLYLFCAFVFFLAWPFLRPLQHGFIGGLVSGLTALPEDELAPILGKVLTWLPTVVGILMVPLLALLLRWFTRGSVYSICLVFSLHYHAAAFLILILAMLVPAAISTVTAVSAIVACTAYMVFALARTFGMSMRGAVVRALLTTIAYLALYFLVVLGTAAVIAQSLVGL